MAAARIADIWKTKLPSLSLSLFLTDAPSFYYHAITLERKNKTRMSAKRKKKKNRRDSFKSKQRSLRGKKRKGVNFVKINQSTCSKYFLKEP
jgi:hypothetical protein